MIFVTLFGKIISGFIEVSLFNKSKNTDTVHVVLERQILVD